MFEMKVRVVFILYILFSLQVAAQRWNIIPAPQQITYNQGFYDVTERDNDLDSAIKFIELGTYDTILGIEGYILEVDTNQIKVSANTKIGLMYAITTIRQVMTTDSTTGQLIIPCAKVVDYPKYAYRGMHLDVSRHFFSKEVIKRYIDELARLKFNYFHWHLTDDQGWRIEIERYPLLTSVGAWRTEKDGTKHGGFYTQDEIREIVAYAADLNITVVPELDLPGHASAAITAYPELSCHGRKIEVPNKWGIMQDVFCPTDSTIIFLKNVLDEMVELFPGSIFHLGGDEVPKNQWKESSLVSDRIKSNGLKNYEQVQHYFMHELTAHLKAKDKAVIGWGEVVRGGMSDSLIVMSWRGKFAGIKAAKIGHPVIMASRFSCYFDYPQSWKEKKSAWWMTRTTLRKVYRYTPTAKTLTKEQNKQVMGGEGTLWTEYVATEAQLFHQLKPRVSALSEAFWGTNTNYKHFKQRLFKK